MKESAIAKLPNPVKSEHLIDGVKPIMVCVGSYEDFDYLKKEFSITKPKEEIEGAHNINYKASTEELERQKFFNSKMHAYVISLVDSLDKFSEGYMDCTGVIVTGTDKTTGENISFLTHQNPLRFLTYEKDSFVENFKKSLNEIKERCKPGTIDAVFLGGKYPTSSHKAVPAMQKEYLAAVELISGEVQKTLGFEPVVVNGPKATEGTDSVFYNNNERRVYLIRPKVNSDINSFTQSGPREENL